MPKADPTIEELVRRKRAAGYDPNFEALMAKRWKCPHCGRVATILEVLVPIDNAGDFACPRCEAEGIEPIEPVAPLLDVVAGGKS